MNAIRMTLRFPPSGDVVISEDVVVLANRIINLHYRAIYDGFKPMVDSEVVLSVVQEKTKLPEDNHGILQETWFCPLQENVLVFEQSAGFQALKQALETNNVEVTVEVIENFDFDNVDNDIGDFDSLALPVWIGPNDTMWQTNFPLGVDNK